MPKRIAILGWGSLLWDQRPEFDNQHHDWLFDGPYLKLEFSRISQLRLGALTLVIDHDNGAGCQVAYALSKRSEPEDALCDLRSREGTTRRNIGYFFLDGLRTHSHDKDSLAAIRRWAVDTKIDVVLWTDLESNFKEICGTAFSAGAALAHVQALTADAKVKAAEYVWRAPTFINTDVRRALQSQPWFHLGNYEPEDG